MRVAMVSNYLPSREKLSEYSFNVVKELEKRKEIEEIIILANKCENCKKYESSKKTRIIRCWSNTSPFSLFKIFRFLFYFKPDVVYFNVHMTSWGRGRIINFFGSLLPFLCRIFRFNVVTTLHNIYEIVDIDRIKYIKNSKINLLGARIATNLILTSNKVTVTMKYIKSVLKDRYKKENIIYIPHGTYGLKVKNPCFGGKNILVFGLWSPHKDLELVINTIREINMEGYGLELTVAGYSHPDYPGYLKRIRRKYKYKFVKYLGYVPENKLGKIFSVATLVILPYKVFTGASSVLNLACSYGRPIIASNLELFHKIIEEEGQAVLFYKDKNSLKKLIKKVISDVKLQKNLGMKNLQVCRKFNLMKTTEMLVSAFEDLFRG